ncbi:neuropeptide-like protein C4orf48 homolog [Protopterus annectens]|uniref:neuropeptide-like protein C4orf48 homolog n=1 Tax=Protopterus annectens TaxID=7888 RepID=UPI001CF98560|nr:neuropeptide-like protein C4orf48 homolog [Protopterus annectens]
MGCQPLPIINAGSETQRKIFLTTAMATCFLFRVMWFIALGILVIALLDVTETEATIQETGTVIPAESRPCVDCHAFEFMQRALQDLKKTAYSLDSRTETLLLRVEKRALCDCQPTNALS